MKKIIISCLCFLIAGCSGGKSDKENNAVDVFNCASGQMTPAWYESGKLEAEAVFNGLKNEFVILVDTNYKASNFISSEEDFLRRQSIDLYDTELTWITGWDKMTRKQKEKKIQEEKNEYKHQADSVHLLNNNGQQQVWIINNTRDTITIQMQDRSFICILQALAKNGRWSPIQYWRFSTCGNSYFFKHFPSKTANSFITKLPNEGNYKTKLRYKLLGEDRFYYSNEFDGRIDYCSFVEDSNTFINRGGNLEPHSKLDSLIHLAWQ